MTAESGRKPRLARAGHPVSVIVPARRRCRERLVRGTRWHRDSPLPIPPRAGARCPMRSNTPLAQTAFLVARLSRTVRFHIVHVCNPPDALGLVALPLKLRGSALIFDHHDLVPELYLSRFGEDVIRCTVWRCFWSGSHSRSPTS